VIYLDASALLTLVSGRPYARELTDYLARSPEMPMDEIRDAAAGLPGGIRTLDALHVASAQAIGDALEVLISYDRRMLDIAHSVGVPVAAPGMSGYAT